MKKVSKRRFADDKKYIVKTGGGPSKPSILNKLDWKIKGIIGGQIEGEVSVYDCDQPSCEEMLLVEGTSDGNVAFVISDADIITRQTEFSQMSQPEISCNATVHVPDTASGFDVNNKSESDVPTMKDTSPTRPTEFSISKLRRPKSSPLKNRFRDRKRGYGVDSTEAGRKVFEVASKKHSFFKYKKYIWRTVTESKRRARAEDEFSKRRARTSEASFGVRNYRKRIIH